MTWEPPEGVSRMDINAALTTLSERWDRDAADLVIRVFATLPQHHFKVQVSFNRTSPPSSTAAGHTPEQGDVSVDVSDTESERAREPDDPTIARMGSFRVMHLVQDSKRREAIYFRQFWASTPEAEGEVPPPSWLLEYEPGTLVPTLQVRFDPVPGKLPWWAFPLTLLPRDMTSFEFWDSEKTTMYGGD